MKKIYLLCFYLLSTYTNISFSQWTSVGQPDFTISGTSDISMKIKQNGNPVVAYKENGTDSLFVYEFINNSWTKLSNMSITNTRGYQPQLSLDLNDIPHVIYRSLDDSIFVKRWNGVIWENFGSSNGYINKGNNASLKFNLSNEPYVVFSNYSVFGGKCSVMSLTGGVWSYYLSTFVTNFQTIDLDFDISSTNTFYISVINSNGNTLSVYKSDLSAWVLLGTANLAGGAANLTKIRCDTSDIPYLLYRDENMNSTSTMRKWNNTNWELVGNQGFSTTSIGYSDFEFVNNLPTVIFQNGNSRVMQYENGTWTTLGSSFGLSNFHALSVRNDNTLFVAYNNILNGYKLNVKLYCSAETNQTTQAICQGENLQFGSQNLSLSGVYNEVFLNSDGCDSSVTLTLNVNPIYATNQTISICSNDSVVIGNSVYTQSGTYQNIFTSQNGCDSTITTQLIVLTNYETTQNETICEGAEFIYNGDTLTETGNYAYAYQAQNGCDSTHILQITVESAIEPQISEMNGILSTVTLANQYEWIDCNSNTPVMPSQTSNEFSPLSSGSYAVQITINQCNWISDCFEFTHATVDNSNINDFTLFPNPATTYLKLSSVEDKKIESAYIADKLGRIVKILTGFELTEGIDVSSLCNGTYILFILDESQNRHFYPFEIVH